MRSDEQCEYHRLGVRTVAEGIETRPKLDVLLAADYERAQGCLFSPPRSIEELVIDADESAGTKLGVTIRDDLWPDDRGLA